MTSSAVPVPNPTSASAAQGARATLERLHRNLALAVRGKDEPLRLLSCALAAGGHVLLEDIPGTGKTTLAKALAQSTGCTFKRVQFTPDLLPTDIVGSSVFNPQTGVFTFKPGPIFTNVLIADEINRASPRTQSALLEAMSEQQVTVEGETRLLTAPFICIATQNPVEFHGTYPLPEAQLDRFTVQMSLGYPSLKDESDILDAHQQGQPVTALTPVASAAEVVSLQRAVDQVIMEATVKDYLLRVVHATRNHAAIRLGVSMRGALMLTRMARARALMHGRDFAVPEDVKALALPVLGHRVVLDTKARYAGADKRSLVEDILGKVATPR